MAAIESIHKRQEVAAASHATALAGVYSALDRLDTHASIAVGVAAGSPPTLRASSPQLHDLAQMDGVQLRNNVVVLIEGSAAEMAAIKARCDRITSALGI